MNQIDRHHLISDVFEFVAENGITTIDEISNSLCISRESSIYAVELLVRFGILEYEDEYDLSIGVSKVAKIILG